MFDSKDYPVTVTIRFKDGNQAEEALHDMEHEFLKLEYNEFERGKNIYYAVEIPGA